MSLINQMLRDLDQQRGPASGEQVAALRGMGLVDNQQLHGLRNLPLLGGAIAIAIAMAVALGYWTAGKLSGGQPAVVEATPVENAAVTLAPEPAHTAMAETRPKQAASANEQLLPEIDEPQPSTPAESPTTPQRTTPLPQQGAIASIEAKPVVEPTPAIDTPAEPPPPRVRTLSPEQKAERLYNQAQQSLAMHRTESAANSLQQALSENPRHMVAREQLAMLMIQNNQPMHAETLLAEGLALSPGRAELAHAYAQLLVERGALLPALESLQHLAERHAAGAETLALQAGIMTRLQRYADAVETYRQALRLQPHQAVWLTGLGVALEHDGRAASALEAYRRAAQLPLQAEIKHFVQQRIQALSGLSAGPQG